MVRVSTPYFHKKAPLWSLFVLCLLVIPLQASETPSQAAIASAHPLATEAGMDILRAGGNAFDASVAVSAVLAVVEPYSSGMGGGGFWLLHRASDGRQVMVDGRERAPRAAYRDMYLDKAGEVIPGASMNGPFAAGIPGEPAALVHIARTYGRLPLSEVLAPAIRLARDGFPVDKHYQNMAGVRLDVLRGSKAAASQFLLDNDVPPQGHVIRQADLAATLAAIARSGSDGFYRGKVALALVEAVRAAGGIWSLQDLAEYQIVERPPVVGEYRGYRIVSSALPSSGGILLLEMLNMLSKKDLAKLTPPRKIHYLVEVMRRAYRDRAQYLGDQDFVPVPVNQLISQGHASVLAADINMNKTSAEISGHNTPGMEGADTTHFSIIDKEGNRVAATLSINYPFGSGFVAPGTGVLLNDEMDDFSAKPGVPNVYGLVGSDANSIAGGKRMLSSMTPTFIEGPDRVAILGTPGGSRIITMVLLAALEFMDGREPQAWVGRPRFHHQYLPDVIMFESGAISKQQSQELSAMGHELRPLAETYGNMQAVMWDKTSGAVRAASDPRHSGQAIVR